LGTAEGQTKRPVTIADCGEVTGRPNKWLNSKNTKQHNCYIQHVKIPVSVSCRSTLQIYLWNLLFPSSAQNQVGDMNCGWNCRWLWLIYWRTPRHNLYEILSFHYPKTRFSWLPEIGFCTTHHLSKSFILINSWWAQVD
jgi:hypothetical protein